MVSLLFISGVLFSVSGVLVGISMALGKKVDSDREKNSPFECGFDPVGSGRLAFSLRFFLVAVIFLVFDVEITLLLPVMVSGPLSELPIWSLLGEMFLLILLAGVIHEWQEGALDWKS